MTWVATKIFLKNTNLEAKCQKNFIKLVTQKKIEKVEQFSLKATQLNTQKKVFQLSFGSHLKNDSESQDWISSFAFALF